MIPPDRDIHKPDLIHWHLLTIRTCQRAAGRCESNAEESAHQGRPDREASWNARANHWLTRSKQAEEDITRCYGELYSFHDDTIVLFPTKDGENNER